MDSLPEVVEAVDLVEAVVMHQKLLARFVVSKAILLWHVGTGRMRASSLNSIKWICSSLSTFATTDCVSDPSWYVDTGAINHVIAELDNLALKTDHYGAAKL